MTAHVIRPARDGDQGFLVGAWLSSYQERVKHAERIPPETYRAGHRAIVLRCLERAPSFVVELPLDGEPELLGFICGGNDWLHYVYVKRAFRGQGLSWQLFEAAGISRDSLWCSHATSFLGAIERRWCKAVKFNPYEVMR